MTTATTARPVRARRLALLLTGAILIGGCFDEPKIEDRWTRVDVAGSNLTTNQMLVGGAAQPIVVSADITYRRIVTGFAVAELRASSSIGPADVALSPQGPRLQMAQDIDRVLANSVTRGRATRAVTGWDHLIQHIDFAFTGTAPAAGDSTSTGLFLVCYIGSGQKVRLPSGVDSVVVTPFGSQTYQILPVGVELRVAGTGSF
jgi:hypothetical protein